MLFAEAFVNDNLLSILMKNKTERYDKTDNLYPKLSINLFIYESGPNEEKIEDILSMQIQILNLLFLHASCSS